MAASGSAGAWTSRGTGSRSTHSRIHDMPTFTPETLDGIYEHSPWVVQAALARGPFISLAALKHAFAQVVAEASEDQQLALLRAHPELAGQSMKDGTLTDASTGEQRKAGLATCTREELARLQQLNRDYSAKFGFPFILAVRGPRGTGLSPRETIDTFERRLANPKE